MRLVCLISTNKRNFSLAAICVFGVCVFLKLHIERENFFFLKTLNGLGHAILGNFSTDQMVIELTKISK